MLAADIHDALPEELRFVAQGLFGETVTHWVRQLENHDLSPKQHTLVINWLAEHRATLEQPPFDNEARQAYARFQTVTTLWEQTDTDELTDIETWRDRLRELHSGSTPDWTASLLQTYADHIECPPFVAHVCLDNRVNSLVETFCKDINSELSSLEFDWQSIITAYVTEGTIPEPDSNTSAKGYQQQAFADIAWTMRESNENIAFDPNIDPPEEPKISATRGGSGGGGSSQFRGRGQQAEAYVMSVILDRIKQWIENEAGDFFQLRSRFKRCKSAQQGSPYSWHVKRVWDNELQPLLDDPNELDRFSVTQWRDTVDSGTSLMDLQFIRLINTTMERGPGFDVIDPRGPLTRDDGQDHHGLWFTPVEIKAVTGETPPFSFRLTTNEYRQANAFVRHGNIPYVIRLVSVPPADTVDWVPQTTIVREKVLKTEEQLKDVVGSQRFEEVVKGGYMNMRLE